jgi:DNA-binding NtrC family response regulator
MRRMLLAWSDRGIDGPTPGYLVTRAANDRGPVLRLLDESTHAYHRAVLLTVPNGLARTQALAEDMRAHVRGEIEIRVVTVDDPSDYAALYAQLGPLARELDRHADTHQLEILLSSGTPQAQTLWVILVQARVLRARMLQVIPAMFVPKPHARAIREVSLDLEGFPEIRMLRDEVTRLRAEVRVRSARLISTSSVMQALMERTVRVAQSELPVLVLGETGAGKELVARAVHDGSARADGPFVGENCGAIAESMLASELFGHEAAAFTGATARHRGLFEQASGGTIFLDEIGELPPQVQAMLLRVLQERTVRRVGGEQAVKVDVRVIAATHRDLEQMVRDGSFREDLYYRLRGATLQVPPLRDRPGDLPALIDAFLREAVIRGKPRKLAITPEAMRLLAAYAWPGNVRELRSEVHRWAVFCDDEVTPADLSLELRAAPRAPARRPSQTPTTLAAVVGQAERRAIESALAANAGNLARTARQLAIERNTLKRKLRVYGLSAG